MRSTKGGDKALWNTIDVNLAHPSPQQHTIVQMVTWRVLLASGLERGFPVPGSMKARRAVINESLLSCSSLCCSVAPQIDHLAQTSPDLHAQLAAIVSERGPEAGGHLPVGLAAPEGGDNVATNMQAQSDYLRDMVVSRRLGFCFMT